MDLKATLPLAFKVTFVLFSKVVVPVWNPAFSFVTSYTKTESAFSYRCDKQTPSNSFIRRKNISDPVLPGPEYEKAILISLLNAYLIDYLKVPVDSLRFRVLRLFLQILYEMILS